MKKIMLLSTLFFVWATMVPSLAGGTPIYVSIYKTATERYNEGKFVEARALFTEVRRMALEDGTYGEMIDYRIALCHEGEGNYREAIKHFKIYADGENINEKVATRAAVQAKIQELEQKLAQDQQKQMALDQAKKAIANLTRQGDKYLNERQFTTALTLYLEVRKLMLQANQYQEIIDFKIATCYQQENDFVNAIRYYRLYLQAPKIQPGWRSKAEVEKHIKDMEKILEKEAADTAAVAMDKKTKELIDLGRLRYRQNRFAEARKAFEDAKTLMQKTNKYEGWIEYFIGNCFQAEQKFQEAVDAYRLYANSNAFLDSLPSKEDILKTIAQLERHIQSQNPETEALNKKIDGLHVRARRLLAEGRPADARKLLEQIKREATDANIYHHKMDYDIAVAYDREGNHAAAIKHYNIYLTAPSFKPGWPDRYFVQNRIQFIKDDQGGKGIFGAGYGYGGGSGSGGSRPQPLVPEDSITNQWWFWATVAVVGVVVIAVVLSGAAESENNAGDKKSMPAGFGGSPVPTPGFNVLRF